MTDAVLLAVADGVARITLNRPDRLNAFDAQSADAWARAATEAVDRADVRAILVRGEGRSFCAGGDVRAMAEMERLGPQLTALARRINDGILALVESAKPVVAAAHGTTAGGGLGVLLSSDYAVIGTRSKVGSLYANVGLSPDLSVSALLARAVGERRALQLTLQERLLTAEEACAWGLAAEVVDDSLVGQRAEEIARHWADNAAEAYGEAKRLVRSAPSRSFADQLDEEARTIGRLAESPDARQRIAAFAAR